MRRLLFLVPLCFTAACTGILGDFQVGGDVADGGGAEGGADGAIVPTPPPTDGGADATPSCGVPGTPCCNGTTCGGGSACVAGSCQCTAPAVPCGVACVTTTNDGKNCGACNHDCVGGQCVGSVCQPITLVSGQSTVNGLAVDATGITWTRASNGIVSGAVVRANLDGTNVTPLFDSGIGKSCSGPSVGGGAVYFATTVSAPTSIMKCVLPSCAGGPSPLATNQPLGGATALDLAGGRLYWVNGTPYNSSVGGAIMTVLLSGGAAERAVTLDQPNPTALVISQGQLFWLDSGTYTADALQTNGGVRKAPLGTAGAATVVASGIFNTDLSGLAVDAQNVYFGGNQVSSAAAVGGGSASPFATTLQNPVRAVASDGTNVYWVEGNTTGKIRSCPKAGCAGTPKLLVDNQDTPTAIVQDATSIYWANYGGGEIRRLAK